MRATRCEVCAKPLSARGNAITGLCYACRQAGAAFARDWMCELRERGFSYKEIAHTLDTTVNTVACRLRERRALERAA